MSASSHLGQLPEKVDGRLYEFEVDRFAVL